MLRTATREDGLSLIETLAGLTVLGFALLLTMSLVAQQSAIERRLDAHHEAVRLLETLLERFRSNLALPADGEVDLSDLPRRVPPAAERLRVFAEVDPLPERRLYEIELTARYNVSAKTYEERLSSMFFLP